VFILFPTYLKERCIFNPLLLKEMIQSKGYAAQSADSALKDFQFTRRDVGAHDVLIEIQYCGVCHSDLHQVRNEWNGTLYPIVPGHEIVGKITAIGNHVTQFKVGDLAGVGCFVDSCRTCPSCRAGLEQYCDTGSLGTYNNIPKGETLPTYGGYSNNIVVDEKYTLKVSDKLALERVAPLLCAGITTYSPLRHWKVGKGHKVAILGLGGLGHMAVKFAVSFGAEVTMLSTSASKEADASKLGAHHFALTNNPEQLDKLKGSFDFIIDTVSATHDVNAFVQLLKLDGAMILLGAPPTPAQVAAFSLIAKRRKLSGSLIGGIAETQEMLDYCAEHNIMSDVEVIPMNRINEAYERMLKSDVKYRFVIDMATL
jgi:alcohol dehydrogenase (NADP+)